MTGRLFAALAASLLVAGCISLAPKSDPVTLYRFGSTPAVAAAPNAAKRVGVLRAPTLFQREAAGDRILTVTGGEIAYLAETRWAAPATVLFDQATATAFESAPGVRLVNRGEPAPAAWSLRLEVRTFEARYERGAKAAPVVVVRVRALLVPAVDRNGAVETLIEARVPAADNRVRDIIPAFDKATGEVLSQLTAWVSEQSTGG